jgi:hypothetical protein
MGGFVERGRCEGRSHDVFVQQLAISLLHLNEGIYYPPVSQFLFRFSTSLISRLQRWDGSSLTGIIIRRNGHIPTVYNLRPVGRPIKPIVDIIRTAGLLFRAAGADTAGSVTCTRLHTNGSIEGEADNGNVEGVVVREIEAALPG